MRLSNVEKKSEYHIIHATKMTVFKRLLVVYDADGTTIGEISYIVGHFLGLRECAACDITHSMSLIGQGTGGQKPAWIDLKKNLPVPIVQLHRNDVVGEKRWGDLVHQLPIIVGERKDGSLDVVVSKNELEICEGNVDSLRVLIERSLDKALPAVKCALRKRIKADIKQTSPLHVPTANLSQVNEPSFQVPFYMYITILGFLISVVHLIRMTP